MAMDEACGAVVDEIDASVDIAFVFFSVEYITNASAAGMSIEDLAEQLIARLGTEKVIGCCGESIVANQYELQWQPAISIWAGHLPSVQLDCCHLEYRSLGDDSVFDGWTDAFAGTWPDGSTIFSFADPFSFPMDVFLDRMNEDRQSIPVLGGMASGVSQPGEARLIKGRDVYDSGAVLIRVSGNLHVDGVVSQGCRPIGSPLVITRAERNEIQELGGLPALQQVQDIFKSLPTREQQMMNQGLYVGRVVSEYIDHTKQGDFLIRNVVHIVEETGSIVIADYV